MSPWSEDKVIQVIQDCLSDVISPLAHGFLDDGAWLPPCPPSATRVVSCDAQQEGTDFLLSLGPPESAGYRAIVQNLSDLAAMGAAPVGFVWSLEVPQQWLENNASRLKAFCEGACRRCVETGLQFFGGDLSLASTRFSCTITIFGDVQGTPLSRRGARVGDGIYLSSPVGASSFGLALLREQRTEPAAAIQAHLFPVDAIDVGNILVGQASACTDISDGLSRDLHRLCRASGVGAFLDNLDDAIAPSLATHTDALSHALYGGEDYALIFTCAAEPHGLLEAPIRIGTITNTPGIIDFKQSNKQSRLPEKGWDAFAVMSY